MSYFVYLLYQIVLFIIFKIVNYMLFILNRELTYQFGPVRADQLL